MADSDLPRVGYDVRQAKQALEALMRDPTDVSQAFRIAGALPGRSLVRMLRQFRATPTGRKLLQEQPLLAHTLSDRAYLASLPDGSLGHSYLRFCDAEGIEPAGLLAAHQESTRTVATLTASDDSEMAFMIRYLRDAHDLCHVVTGYRSDLIGEPALAAFMFAQTFSPGLALIVTLVFLRAGGHLKGLRATMITGLLRGLRSKPLTGADWIALLPRPLSEVRAQFEISAPTTYHPIWVTDFPGGKLPYL